MAACPSCGKELPGEFPFCPYCAAPIVAHTPPRAAEERKVVSVLFCDLVGFTAASEHADPEDVRARIRPYHARLRQEIERHGGTVEKFVGDAVMAVFGAPVAHEDDAERAVRAGLRILDAIEELNHADPRLELQVRVGINTGEAVVALGAHPEQGEGFVTGDVVNTASRLQGAAPVNAVAVSEQTFRQTERVFTFEALEPVTVKGKSEPLRVWRALAARARLGEDVTRTPSTPLVGRELESPLLIATFERAAKQRTCQLVTVVGEPGVGKSRLCMELFQHIEQRPGLVRWRQGRCLPYGEGIAFWALGEIVKSQCGILESDAPDVASAKLDVALPESDPDLAWLKARLAPLVGAGGEPAAQEESFTAWRRFLESLAAEHETVLLFEDLHWADDALLGFLEHMADWSEGVPLLVLCTARPELFERHPHFGARARNAQRINLAPLGDLDTATLLGLLLEQAVLPAATQQALLERAGGNPLYAEEFVRLLSDRGLLSGPLEHVPLPDSVQALIAARLDTLTPERKALLQDAAVVGNVFWAGAVAEMGTRDPREVELALHELARKELVRPTRTSSMQGEQEFRFWHVLVRDVCYAQIPRPARAARHRSAAAWIERKAGGRLEDLADVLAYHYVQALELARAAGLKQDIEELESGARRYLALAGDRALPLDVDSAQVSLARALELAPAGHRDRAGILERWAEAAQQQGRWEEAKAALEEALARYRELGETVAAGRVLTALGPVLHGLGDPRSREVVTEALALLESVEPGPELVAAQAELASLLAVGAAYMDSIAAADRALQLAADLGIATPVQALGYRGGSRACLGDPQGLDDMRRALALGVEQGRGRQAAVLHNNLAFVTWQYEGSSAALERCREGVDFCERRGIVGYARHIASTRLTFLAEVGRSQEALTEAGPLAERTQAAGQRAALIEARSVQLMLFTERGEGAQMSPDARHLSDAARETREAQLIAVGFAAAAQVLLAQGQGREAKALLNEAERTAGMRADPYYAAALPRLVRVALALYDPELASRLAAGVEPLTPYQQHSLSACRAALAESAGHGSEAAAMYAEAAERWRQFGNVPELGYALLGRGRCLVALDDPAAEEPLGEAAALFLAMGYKPALAETQALLDRRPGEPHEHSS